MIKFGLVELNFFEFKLKPDSNKIRLRIAWSRSEEINWRREYEHLG